MLKRSDEYDIAFYEAGLIEPLLKIIIFTGS